MNLPLPDIEMVVSGISLANHYVRDFLRNLKGHETFRVSYSSLSTASACPRKFQLNKLYPQPPRGPNGLAANAGHAIHTGYQTFLHNQDVDEGLFALGLAYPHMDCWDSFNDRSWEACMATYMLMVQKFKGQHWQLAMIKNHLGETVPAVEVPIELVFEGVRLPDGRQISFVGYVDQIMFREEIKGIKYRIEDTKTHRNYTVDRTANYIYSGQPIPYAIALEHVLGHAIDSFEVNFLDCFVDVLNPKVEDYTYDKTQQDIQDWLYYAAKRITDICRYSELGHFPRTESGCTSYMKPCHRMDICAAREPESLYSLILGGGQPAPIKEFNPWIKATIDMTNIGGIL